MLLVTVTAVLIIAVSIKRRSGGDNSNSMHLEPPIPPPQPTTRLSEMLFYGQSHETTLNDDADYSYPIVQLSDNALYGQSPLDIPLIDNVAYTYTSSCGVSINYRGEQ